MNWRKFWRAVTLTGTVYGFAGWVYIALVALIHPHTLGLQLTHFFKFPHEDTFGAICFLVSLISFCIYNLIKEDKKISRQS